MTEPHLDVHLDHPDRRLALSGAYNVRDLGGYPTDDGRSVRWRTLYRADALHRLDDDELDVLGQRGISVAMDLRTNQELERGQLRAEHLGIVLHHLPVLGVTWTVGELDLEGDPVEVLARLYVHMLDVGAPALAAALDLLVSDGALPALFHCSAGKDRTGVLAALVLTLLGVRRDVVVADYALTSLAMERMEERIRETRADWGDRSDEGRSPLMEAPAEAMARFLDHLDSHFGSAAGYVTEIGCDPGIVEELRGRLLDPPS